MPISLPGQREDDYHYMIDWSRLGSSPVDAMNYHLTVEDQSNVRDAFGFQSFERQKNRHGFQDVYMEPLKRRGPSALCRLGRDMATPTTQGRVCVNDHRRRREVERDRSGETAGIRPRCQPTPEDAGKKNFPVPEPFVGTAQPDAIHVLEFGLENWVCH